MSSSLRKFGLYSNSNQRVIQACKQGISKVTFTTQAKSGSALAAYHMKKQLKGKSSFQNRKMLK
jgi:hypothetical protein